MEPVIRNALSSVLKNETNIDIFSKHLLSLDFDDAKDVLYEVVTALRQGDKVRSVYQRLVGNEIGFRGPAFESQRLKQEEEDEFITNPAEVEEGVHECDRCGSKRTMSYTRQINAGDESTAVWAQCVQCGKKWRA